MRRQYYPLARRSPDLVDGVKRPIAARDVLTLIII